MANMIKTVLRSKSGVERKIEVDVEQLAEAGVLKLEGKYFAFHKIDGQYFNLPVFEEVDFLDLDTFVKL